MDGTSFAAPIVSGIAALLLSVKSDLINAQIETIIENSAEDKGTSGFDNYYGYGRVNAARAVKTVVAPTNFHITNSTGWVNLAWDTHPTQILSHYSVERKINSGSWAVIGTTGSTSFTDVEAQIGGLTPTDFSYRVQAISSGNIASLYSNTVGTSGRYFPSDEQNLNLASLPTEFSLHQNHPSCRCSSR